MKTKFKLAPACIAVLMAASVTLSGCNTDTVEVVKIVEVSAPLPELIDNGVPLAERQDRAMRILLINDDSYDGEGIQLLYEQLVAADYDVWLVAPLTQQSGAGTSILWNKEPHELVDHGDQKYAFEGTPTDSFKVAVNVLMPEKPDLVISGVNDGPNWGEVQFNSGTVGGAARAVRHGYPAIAASLTFFGGPDLIELITPAVEFTVDMVNELNDEWKAGRMLMPQGTGLSINYPAMNIDDGIKGVKFVPNEEVLTDFQNYKIDEADGLIYNAMDQAALAGVDPNSDIALALDGWVTITTFDGNWNASQQKDEYMQDVLSELQP